MPRDVSFDNPALHREDDEFNRWPFSKRLADTIAAFDTTGGSPVLGLFGKWGYGKSTVLNFLRDELEREHHERIKIFEFNPWLFKDQDTLLKEFFEGLVATIEQSLGTAGRTAGNLLTKYGGALSAIPVVGAGLKDVAKAVGEDMARNSVQNQRTQVVEIMRKATSTIVVLIDDLDRLDRDDIMTVLKLVRLSANFPHVIYVLAFDDEMVARAAGEKYGGGAESGRQFLEKIVQYPFSLPAIRPDRLVEFVLRRAREACAFAEIELSDKDWEVFRGLARNSFSVRLGTPRQAIRYANALRFALPMLKDEVDPLTQMAVEGLRTLFPELYAFAREKYVSLRKTPNKGEAGIKEAMKGSSQEHQDAGSRLLLQFLDKPERRSETPVFNSRYFDRYFSYTVAPEDISERDVNALLSLAAEDKPELAAELRRMAKINALQLLESLQKRVTQLDLEQRKRLARILAKEGVIFAPPGESVFENPLSREVAKLIIQIFSGAHITVDSLEPAAEIIRQAEPLPLALLFLEQVYSELRIPIPKDNVPSGQIKMLHFELCSRIKGSAELAPLYLSLAPSDALRLLKEWRICEPKEPADWLTRRLREHPQEAASFLELFRGGKFSYQEVNELVDAEVLSRIVTEQLALEDQRLAGRIRIGSSWIDVGREFLSEHKKATGAKIT